MPEKVSKRRVPVRKQKRRRSIIVTVFSSILMAIAFLIGGWTVFVQVVLEREARRAMTEQTVSATESALLGNYDVRFEYADSTVRFTGVIDKNINDELVLTILSDYAPRVIMLSIGADGDVNSNELGSGTMTYKPGVEKTIIKFNKENYTCTLTK